MRKICTGSFLRHFIRAFDVYTHGCAVQAEDRAAGRIRDIESYFDLRRDTTGVKPSIAICEIQMNLPDDVVDDPIISRLMILCNDFIIIENDVYSYNVE